MDESVFQQGGGSYSKVGDYLLPDIVAGGEEVFIGPWGQRHLRFLRKTRPVTYTNLLTSGELPGYLADIDRQAQELYFRIVDQLSKAEGVTEQLKAADQMEWVRRMNGIRSWADEIVNNDLIMA